MVQIKKSHIKEVMSSILIYKIFNKEKKKSTKNLLNDNFLLPIVCYTSNALNVSLNRIIGLGLGHNSDNKMYRAYF